VNQRKEKQTTHWDICVDILRLRCHLIIKSADRPVAYLAEEVAYKEFHRTGLSWVRLDVESSVL